MPTRVHTAPLSENWEKVEKTALRAMLTWLDPPEGVAQLGCDLPISRDDLAATEATIKAIRLPSWRRNVVTWAICRDLLIPLVVGLSRIRSPMAAVGIAIGRTGRALSGDSGALRWLRWRFRKAIAELLGRPFHEPAPEITN